MSGEHGVQPCKRQQTIRCDHLDAHYAQHTSPIRHLLDAHQLAQLFPNISPGLRLFTYYVTRLEQGSIETSVPLHISPRLENLLHGLDRHGSTKIGNARLQCGPYIPPRKGLTAILDTAFDRHFIVFSFLDRDEIEDLAIRLAAQQSFNTTSVPWNDLALVYALFALGTFSTVDDGMTDTGPSPRTGSSDIDSLKWFHAAQALVDPKECHRSLVALQTVLCMAELLAAMGDFTMCFTYVQHAADAVVSMSQLEPGGVDRTRSRIHHERTFRAVQIMDTIIASAVCKPRHSQLQQLKLTPEVHFLPGSTMRRVDGATAAEAYLKLLDIYGLASTLWYPLEPNGYSPVSIAPSVSDVLNVSTHLEDWIETHRHFISPNLAKQQNSRSIRSKLQLLLTAAYANTWRAIFFPFLLHWVDSRPIMSGVANDVQEVFENCAQRCVEGAIVSINASGALYRAGLLNGSYIPDVRHLIEARLVLLIAHNHVSDKLLSKHISNSAQGADLLLKKLSPRGRMAVTLFDKISVHSFVPDTFHRPDPIPKIEVLEPEMDEPEQETRKRPGLKRSRSSKEFWQFIQQDAVLSQ